MSVRERIKGWMAWVLALVGKLVSRVLSATAGYFWPHLRAHLEFPWTWQGKSFVAALTVVLYYAVGALVVECIDTDPGFASKSMVGAHQSRAVLMASALTYREVADHHWTPADPVFLPGWTLTSMSHFQEGLIGAAGRFSDALSMAEGGADGDLIQAAGLFRYPATVWRIAPAVPWLPFAPSNRQYHHAAQYLDAYNDRLGRGGAAGHWREADGLTVILGEAARDLDHLLDRTDHHLDTAPSALLDGEGRALFQSNRGRLYAWGMILRDLGQDDAGLIEAKGMAAQWRKMVDGMLTASRQDPLVVTVGSPEGSLFANHLTEQGYFIERARAGLADLTRVLAAN